MLKSKFIFFIISFIFSSLLWSQNENDFLLSELKKTDIADTQRVYILNELSENYRYSDSKKSFEYGYLTLELAKKINFPNGVRMAYLNLGNAYLSTNQYDSSEFYLNLTLKINKEFGFSDTKTYNALGNLSFYQSDYEKSLDWYLKLLESGKKENDSTVMGKAYGNIGNVYYYLQNIPKVKENFNKSLLIKKALKDSLGIAHTMGNMGNLYVDEGDYDSAFYYFNTSKNIFESKGNLYGVSTCLTSIGEIYLLKKEFNNA